MDYIYGKLQSKYLLSNNPKQKIISLRKQIDLGNECPVILKISPRNSESSNRFTELYKGFFQKNRKILPKLMSINENVDLKQNRNCTFADPRYPKYLQKNISRFEKPKRTLNIIEALDDPEEMKYYYESSYEQFMNEQSTNTNIESLIDILLPKVLQFEYSPIYTKIHQYTLSSSDITLELKGICLLLRDLSSNQIKKPVKLRLPLSIIPFYYSISHSLFLFFIAKIVKIQLVEGETDISSIYLDIELLKKYIEVIASEDKLFSSNSTFINTESYNKSQQSVKYTWLINNKELELEIQPLTIKLKALISSYCLTQSYFSENKIKNNKLIIKKIISKNLMCNFIQNSYFCWEKAALCYLSSFKSFRKLITYAYGRPMKTNNIDFFIDLQDGTINKNQYRQSIGHNEGKQFPLNKSSFSFFMTLNNDNYFFIFYSYGVSLRIDSFKKKQFNFALSFDKMKFLYQLKSKYNINDIVRKCIIVNRSKETVSCSIELLKGIAFESMDKFFESKDELNALQSTLQVSLPRIEWEEMVDINSIVFHEIKTQKYFLKDIIVEQLLNVDRNQWFDIFSQFQDEFVQVIEQKVMRSKHQLKSVKDVLPALGYDISGKRESKKKFQNMKSIVLKHKSTNGTKVFMNNLLNDNCK